MIDQAVLTESKFRIGSSKIRIQTVLRNLGITFKEGSSFWLVNEAEIEYLYQDLCQRARQVRADLHPQRGGNPREFSRFNDAIERAKELFYRHGIQVPGRSLVLLRKQQDSIVRSKAAARVKPYTFNKDILREYKRLLRLAFPEQPNREEASND